MAKIIKNLSDAEMFKNYKEELTFEHTDRDGAAERRPEPVKKAEKEVADRYLTPELADQIEKALLELKIKLYKDGIVDYKYKVSQDNGKVVIIPLPFMPKQPKETSGILPSEPTTRRTNKKR